jgi:hypothetical protein
MNDRIAQGADLVDQPQLKRLSAGEDPPAS